MAFKSGGRILGHFPVGNTANTTDSPEPFVSEPASRPAVSGISDQKGLVAVRRNSGLVPQKLNGLDSMQQPPPRGPEFNLIN